MKTNDGGPAFPLPAYLDDEDGSGKRSIIMESDGMTLRDWFAGMALQGLLPSMDKLGRELERTKSDAPLDVFMCALAYRHADAMLVQRERTK